MRKLLQYILWFLAKLILWRYRPFVIAITGSVGKTTTREAVFCGLNHFFPGRVRQNRGNLNSEIGVPLTIIGGREADRNIFLWIKNFAIALISVFSSAYPKVLVLELAADRPGDIKFLAKLVRPHVSVVTAVGEMPVHLEYFESREEYVQEKSAVLSYLRKTGTAILNADDMTLAELPADLSLQQHCIRFGMSDQANVRLKNIQYDTAGNVPAEIGIRFVIEDRGHSIPVRVSGTLGSGVAYAVAAATAVLRALKIDAAPIADAFVEFRPLPGRMNMLEGARGVLIIDDSYNSSPIAVRSALNSLAQFSGRRRVAVLGDMLELGENIERAHRLLGKQVASSADAAVLIGEHVRFTAEELRRLGFKDGETLFLYRTSNDAAEEIYDIITDNDVVLVKGSQSIRAEKVIKRLIKNQQKAEDLLVRQYGRWLRE